MNKLKRVIITEELVNLTGDPISAIILNQFIYWSTKAKEIDEYLQEEKHRLKAIENGSKKTEMVESTEVEKFMTHGWIYKKADELSDELMGLANRKTIRKKINYLIDSGWIKERKNPKYNWDKTIQYRVDLIKIEQELRKIGYTLATILHEQYPKVFADTSEWANLDIRWANLPIREGEFAQTIPEYNTEIKKENNKVYKEYNCSEPNKFDSEHHYAKRSIPVGFNFFLSHKTPPPSPDTIKAVKYYLSSYQKYMGKEHPRLKFDQWEKVIEKIKSVDGFDLDVDDLKAMTDKHFQTKYREGCDYNILHFVSEGVLLRKMYEVAY